MDEYIRMCCQANEIQELWQPEIADTYYLKDSIWNINIETVEGPIKKEDFIQKGVWIPRQEDFQQIISNYQRIERKIDDWTPWVLIQKLYRYMDEPQIKWNSDID